MKLGDMFPARFLGGQDLPKPILIQIVGVRKISMRAGQGKPEEQKWVLEFCNVSTGHVVPVPRVLLVDPEIKSQGLVLRKTLSRQINAALGVDDTDDWLQKRVVIYPCEARVAGETVTSLCARKYVPTPTTTPTAANSGANANNSVNSVSAAAAPAGTVPTATGK